MKHLGCILLILAYCSMLAAGKSDDNVLRFVSQKDLQAHKVQTKSDEIIVVRGEEQPIEKFRPQNIMCPNGVMQCSGDTTCCPLQDGLYGCCDGLNAVCCRNGGHCCPEGYTCDEKRGRCQSVARGISFNWVDRKVVHARPVLHSEVNVTCSDKKTVCEKNDTCCNATSPSAMGCCPLEHAVCCSDKAHCCPAGTTCDLVHKRCFRRDSNWEQPLVERRRPTTHTVEKKPKVNTFAEIASPLKSVVCPDKASECPDGTTCCQLASEEWGCCPKPNAVCCPDKVHCCPQSYTCDQASGTCKSPAGQLFIPWEEKKPATPRVSSGAVVCPDRRTQCADGQTCCQEVSGDYGCCPYAQAVCCSDKTHCCPSGFSCNLKEKTCVRGHESIAMLGKQPPQNRLPTTVVCPDGQSQCSDDQTCCKTASGAYGCCPSPNATCCSDHVHCCPEGMKCDLATQKCYQSLPNLFRSVPLLKKEPAIRNVEKVVCPDGQSDCPDGQTCCKMSTGTYGCCPKPNAVCCSDGLHCCPQGYTCDVSQGRCNQGLLSVPWDQKQPAGLP